MSSLDSFGFETPAFAEQAACKGMDPAIFVPNSNTARRGNGHIWDAGKAVCAKCPVVEECFEYGMGVDDDFAIYGGLSPYERNNVKRKRELMGPDWKPSRETLPYRSSRPGRIRRPKSKVEVSPDGTPAGPADGPVDSLERTPVPSSIFRSPDKRSTSSRFPGVSQWSSLSDASKEQMCRSVLMDLGAEQIQQRGDELNCCCVLPFHQDAHPSASLNFKKLAYKCFSCGSGGSILWLIAVCRDISGTAARSWVQSRTSSVDSEDSLSDLLAYFDSLYQRKEREPIPTFSPSVLEPWALRHPYWAEVRHVPESVQDLFGLGYDPASKRVIIPVWWREPREVAPERARSKLVGWQSRRLVNDGSPKYSNSPEFPKSQVIYNYAPRRDAVLVESALSVLSRYEDAQAMGYNIESTLGASVSERQLRLLGRHDKVVLFFDPDKAGLGATESVGKELMAHTDVRVVVDPKADPGDMSSEEFCDHLARAVPFGIWKP